VTLRVVVLDVDDTLYLERDYVWSGFVAVGVHVERTTGVPGLAAAAWDEFERGARGDVLDRALARLGPAAVRPIDELVAIYREHVPNIAPSPDSIRLLGAVRGVGLRVGVITDGPGIAQRSKLQALDLGLNHDDPAVVVTADLGPGRGKPAPDAFLAVEFATGRKGRELVYIADNPQKDFQAPHALGWRTVRVRRAGGLHEGLNSGNDVSLEVTDLDQAAAVLFGVDGG
jgi:putative hydrolase of the HAD superfamily